MNGRTMRGMLPRVCLLALCTLALLQLSLASPSPSSSSQSAASSSSSHKHALLVAIPLPGHVNPLLSQSAELLRRGWSVTVASPHRMKSHIESAIAATALEQPAREVPRLSYMDLGDCAAIGELSQALRRSADHEDYMQSAREMFDWSLSLHCCMYRSLAAQIPQLHQRPDVMVVDFATYGAFDAAEQMDIPYVVNNADLLNMLSPDDVEPYDFIPGTMTAMSLSYFNGSTNAYGLLPRVLYPPLRVVLRYLAAITAERQLHEQQQQCALAPTSLFKRHDARVILVNNVFGLEYARPLHPNIVMVGPMLAKRWEKDLVVARRGYESELNDEDREWLNHPAPVGTSKRLPVVWVSMGTIAPLNSRQVKELYEGLARGARAGEFRVLWKVTAFDRQQLPSDLPPSSAMRLLAWVSSQMGVLAHEATEVFISHCGINSVHESVYLEKKLLCIPILADQADMAARVQDAGVGVHLSKSTFNASSLHSTLLQLLSPSSTAHHASRLHWARSSMLLTGGVVKAVDLIEYVEQHGSAALIPIHKSHPWYVRYNVDVIAVHALLLGLLYVATKAMLRCVGRCCGCRKSSKQANKQQKGQKAD